MAKVRRGCRILYRMTALVIAIVGFLLPTSGQADDQASEPAGNPYCGRLAEFEVALAREFNEQLIAVAQASGDVVRLYVSASGRSWTLLAIAAAHPNWACIVGSGTDFDFVAPAPSDASS